MRRIDDNRLLIERSGDMHVDALIYTDESMAQQIESGAIDQLRDAARLPGVYRAVGTPDMHFGFGVPIGVVVALEDYVVPAAVGYDINCGMRVITTPLDAAEVDVDQLAGSIARDIPLGEGKNNVSLSRDKLEVILNEGVAGIAKVAGGGHRVWEARDSEEEKRDMECIEENGSMDGDSSKLSNHAVSRGLKQLGTLGGGNHFVEMQVVEEVHNAEAAEAFGLREKQLVIMLHSGSWGLGHQVCGDYAKLAKKINGDRSPGRELCFLRASDKAGRDYIGAMNAAANFAFANRQLMTLFVRMNVRHHYGGDLPMPIIYDVPHNMAKREGFEGRDLWVHRKGATRAFPPSKMAGTRFEKTGQPVLIPGSMGTPSYVLIGKEASAESLYSVNHGAGRCMSRTAARGKVTRKGKVLRPGKISDQEFRDSMAGIKLICANRHMIKEEAPQAYKDIDHVIRIVVGAGLAEVVAKMRPLAVLKG